MDVQAYIGWKNGRFIFERQTLEDSMRTLSRWYDVQVVFQSEKARHIEFTGKMCIRDRERTTGSFGVITPRNIETKLQSNLSSVLEGQATGVVLDKDGKIEIRGVSTFNAENEPLVAVSYTHLKIHKVLFIFSSTGNII